MTQTRAELKDEIQQLQTQLADVRQKVERLVGEINERTNESSILRQELESARKELAVREKAMAVTVAKYDVSRDTLRDLFAEAIARRVIAR